MKTEKKETRQDKLDDGQTYTGFTFKGRKHRPLTAGALKFLQRIGSPLYTNKFEGYSEVDMLIEYLFATSATPDEMAYAIDNWNTVQFIFANDYSIKDLTDPILSESLSRDIGNQSAASIEVKDDSMGKSQKEIPVTG